MDYEISSVFERNGGRIVIYFKYTNVETDYLKDRDPILGKEIEIGFYKKKGRA